MAFQSFEFLALFLGLLVLYWTLPHVVRNPLLLAASYVFYGYVHPWLLFLLAGYTLLSYVSTIGIQRYPESKRPILWISVVAALSTLAVFKYFGFFVDSFGDALESIGLGRLDGGLEIFLPIGISFYTFQTIGYIVDVYRGSTTARTNPVDVALFVSFFPQLVAGPIERASRMFPQIEARRSLTPNVALDGVMLILWGFFKKLVIADNVAFIVNRIFSLQEPDFFLIWVGVLAFGIQIYADFAGYTDIARGTAKLFGIELSQNFRAPYLSRSPVDFWRRWHVSLSSWFRDYVYIPMGGARRGYYANILVLMVTFGLTGLWHGASWNFVLWGLYHGVAVQGTRMASVSRYASLLSGTIGTIVSVGITLWIVMFGWLLFREQDLGQISSVLQLDPFAASLDQIKVAWFLLGQVVVYSLPLWAFYIYEANREKLGLLISKNGVEAASALVGAAMLLAILVMNPEGNADFIYFQF